MSMMRSIIGNTNVTLTLGNVHQMIHTSIIQPEKDRNVTTIQCSKNSVQNIKVRYERLIVALKSTVIHNIMLLTGSTYITNDRNVTKVTLTLGMLVIQIVRIICNA